MLAIIFTLHAGYIVLLVSVRGMLMENRPVDPGSIQGRNKDMRERPSVKLVKLSSNNHIVGLVRKHHIINQLGEEGERANAQMRSPLHSQDRRIVEPWEERFTCWAGFMVWMLDSPAEN